MIVLHKQELIFLKTRKVAGTSFEIALSSFADETSILTPISPEDEEHRRRLGFRDAQNYKHTLRQLIGGKRRRLLVNAVARRRLPVRYYNHIGATELKALLGEELWDRYDKVSIVRNPFDLIVSRYFWDHRNTPDPASIEDWLIRDPEIPLQNRRQCSVDGLDVIDHYIRYDRLEEDVQRLEKAKPGLTGLWDIFSSIRAKGQHRPAGARRSEFLTDAPKTRALVELLCADEIKRFGFESAWD